MGLGLTHYIPFIVYICAFVVIFLTIFYRVEYGLFFLVPLIPLQPIWFKLFEYPLGKDLLDFLIIALLIGWFIRKKQNSEKTPNFFPIFLLIIISFSGLFIGANEFSLNLDNPYFRFWKNFIIMPILYLITFNNIREEKYIKILIFLMTLSMLANDFYFRNTFEWFKSEHFYQKGRISTFEDLGPNEMASFVSQGTILLLGIWLTYKHKWSRYWIGFVILANFYVILYSYSRGSYLAVLAACIFLGLIKERRILFALLLVIVLWTSILPNSVVERINMTQNEQGELDHASQVRIDVWYEGLNSFAQNPLGIGFAHYQSLGFGDTGKRDAHNMFVKMIVELGIQGLSIYILLYLLGIRSGWNLYRTADNGLFKGLGLGFIACIIANIVCNLFGQDWMLFSVTTYYWVFWALVERARVITQERAKTNLVVDAVAVGQ